MKRFYKFSSSLLIVLLLTSVLGYSNNIDNGKFKKTKTVEKKFSVSGDNTVDIDNKYGDLTITTWDQNRVSIVVKITVNSHDEDAVQDKLDGISIEFNQANNTVYAKTIFKSKSKKWGWFGTSSSVDMKIDYEIKMPTSNNVNLNNDYGTIFIDELKGSSTINCDYGGIRIGELLNDNNSINLDYGQSSTIRFMKAGEINSDYSKLVVEEAGRIDLNADYSQIELNEVEKLNYNNDYGSLNLGIVSEVVGDSDYLSFRVDEVIKKIVYKGSYGSFKLKRLHNNFEEVSINTNYTGIKIGVDPETSFDFTTTTSFADVNFDDLEVEYTQKISKNFSKAYKGNVSRENPNSVVKINSEYGNIKIYKFK